MRNSTILNMKLGWITREGAFLECICEGHSEIAKRYFPDVVNTEGYLMGLVYGVSFHRG